MTDPDEQRNAYGGAHQAYFLEVPGAASAAELSVVSFEAVERLGDTYTVTIQLTHPLPLDQADYLGKDATFLIDPGDGTAPRKFGGCVTGFSETRQPHDFCAYEIVLEPLVARLRLTRARRVFRLRSSMRPARSRRGMRCSIACICDGERCDASSRKTGVSR